MEPTPERPEDWLAYAESEESGANWRTTRPGKRVALFDVVPEKDDRVVP